MVAQASGVGVRGYGAEATGMPWGSDSVLRNGLERRKGLVTKEEGWP